MHHDNLQAQTSYIISFLGRRFSSLFLDIFGMFQGHSCFSLCFMMHCMPTATFNCLYVLLTSPVYIGQLN